MFFRLVTSVVHKKIPSPMRNRTSNLWIRAPYFVLFEVDTVV